MLNDFAKANIRVRFMHMCNEFDPDQLVAFAICHDLAPNIPVAHYALKGLQQWLACHDYGGEATSRHVMLSGPVYKMHQAFVLNTVSYAQFCRTYVGEFVHILNTNTAEQVEYVNQTGWLDDTLSLLAETFGNDLSPALASWQQQHYCKEVPIAAVSVMGHDALKYQKISDLVPQMKRREFFTHLRGQDATVL
jgi:hypothetical protein